MNKEQTQTKRWEVTLQKTATYETTIEIEAETEDEARELIQAQAENGDHWGEFGADAEIDVSYEVTDSACLSDED